MIALQQKIMIRNDIDVINARMAVREFARRCGFSARDQACISLVSSSVASILKLEKEVDLLGVEVLMEACESGQQQGVRVSCIKHHTKMHDQDVNSRLKSSYLLVDDIQMKSVSRDGIEVVVTKWNSSYKG